MKRILFAMCAIALSVVGCTSGVYEEPNSDTPPITPSDSQEFYASLEGSDEGETKTYLDEDVKLLWHADDRISLFRSTLNEQFRFKGETGDNAGTFALVPSDEWGTGNEISNNYGVYPYNESNRLTNREEIQLTLPSVQTYAPNSFGKGANTMVAATENIKSTFLPFRNVCGYLLLKLYSERASIASIELKGNNNEVLAGSAVALAEYGKYPLLTMNEGGLTTITLNCDEGARLSTSAEEPTQFWLVVPPTTFEAGFTITITDIYGNVTTKSTSKSKTIERNGVISMAAFEIEAGAPKPAANEILYTNGSTTEATNPYKTDVFGANIISNTYDEDKECWVIKFDGNITAVGEDAFRDCRKLTSISIPEGVTTIGYGAFYGCPLNSISLPNSVTSIDGYVFYNCILSSIFIPSSVTSIGEQAFYYCDPSSVVVAEDNTKYDSRENCNAIIETATNKLVYGFSSSVIPEGVTSIGYMAFYYRYPTSITIPASVTSIGGNAFEKCSYLKSVYCNSKTPPTLGNTYVFSTNALGRTIYVPVGCAETYKAADGWKNYASSIAEFVPQPAANEIWYTNGSETEATVPNNAEAFGANIISNTYVANNGYWVLKFDENITSIGEEAFNGCSTLESITLPNSVTSIAKNAFKYCSNLVDIEIPNSVTEIGIWAFDRCSSLESITIPEGVTSIGEGAFSVCPKLEEFKGKFASEDGRCLVVNDTLNSFAPAGLTEYTIPDGIVAIGFAGFYECSELESITIPESVTSIRNYAFGFCSGLKSMLIPESVTDILYGAFWSCKGLESVEISEGVTSIGGAAFRGCTSLTNVTIPASVTVLGSEAFKNCSNLTSVYCNAQTPPITTIASTITSWDAFESNASGRTIYAPAESVEKYQAAGGWKQYADCIVAAVPKPAANEIWYTYNMGGITAPLSPYNVDAFDANIVSNAYDEEKGCWVIKFDKNITVVGEKAFYQRTLLDSIIIPEGVISIGNYAFYGCILRYITLPSSVNNIGDHAFYICSISKITLPAKLTTIGGYAFQGCYLTNVTIPEGVTSIGEAAFRNCSELVSISFPASATSIGDNVLTSCDKLTNIVVAEGNPKYDSRENCNALIETSTNKLLKGSSSTTVIPESVTSIGKNAFSGCKGLTNIVIPQGVTSIGYSAFHGCSNLTSVTIPESVCEIDTYAFSGCKFTSITIPKGVTQIGQYAFSNLTNIVVAEGNSKYDSRENCNAIIETATNKLLYASSSTVIPESVTSIGRTAFYGSKTLTSITIPASITSIGEEAFSYCSGLTTITIPNSVTSIALRAFANCTNLTSVYCNSKTPPNIGSSVFYKNASGRKIYVPAGCAEAYKAADGWKTYANDIVETLPAANEIWYTSTDGNQVTPNRTPVSGLTLNSNTYNQALGMWVLSYSSSITEITVEAFAGCSKLQSIILPEGVKTIRDDAFSGCSGLKNLTLPTTVTAIDYAAFRTAGLSNIYISDADAYCKISFSNKSIETNYNIYLNNQPLTSVTYPESVKVVGYRAFRGCKSITDVTMHDAMTEISSSAFDGCTNLANVTIGENVTRMGRFAFWGCTSLTEVTIPSKMKNIADSAFRGCSNLKTIYCEATTPPIADDYSDSDDFHWRTFDNIASGAVIYVPAESVEIYKKAAGWDEYASMIQPYNFN